MADRSPSLVCAYCDGPLQATLEYKSNGYLSHEVPGPIECAANNICLASWHPDGQPWTDSHGKDITGT